MTPLDPALKAYKHQTVIIGYFKASILNLPGIKYEEEICNCCNTLQKLFCINPNPHPKHDFICVNCIQTIEIKNSHDTDVGFVSPEIPEELKNEDARRRVKAEYYAELLRTPQFNTLQGRGWISHCKDFMDYIGTWEAPDFTRASKGGNGRKLFKSMTRRSERHLWDLVGLDKDEMKYSWEDTLYHTFSCRHCNRKLGYWECF